MSMHLLPCLALKYTCPVSHSSLLTGHLHISCYCTRSTASHRITFWQVQRVSICHILTQSWVASKCTRPISQSKSAPTTLLYTPSALHQLQDTAPILGCIRIHRPNLHSNSVTQHSRRYSTHLCASHWIILWQVGRVGICQVLHQACASYNDLLHHRIPLFWT